MKSTNLIFFLILLIHNNSYLLEKNNNSKTINAVRDFNPKLMDKQLFIDEIKREMKNILKIIERDPNNKDSRLGKTLRWIFKVKKFYLRNIDIEQTVNNIIKEQDMNAVYDRYVVYRNTTVPEQETIKMLAFELTLDTLEIYFTFLREHVNEIDFKLSSNKASHYDNILNQLTKAKIAISKSQEIRANL